MTERNFWFKEVEILKRIALNLLEESLKDEPNSEKVINKVDKILGSVGFPNGDGIFNQIGNACPEKINNHKFPSIENCKKITQLIAKHLGKEELFDWSPNNLNIPQEFLTQYVYCGYEGGGMIERYYDQPFRALYLCPDLFELISWINRYNYEITIPRSVHESVILDNVAELCITILSKNLK